MTKAEAKSAMDAGKRIGWENGAYAFYDLEHVLGPYVISDEDGLDWTLTGTWAWGGNFDNAYILPERKTRPCSQMEVLMVQTNPNRVVRNKADGRIWASQCIIIDESVADCYEWAEFDDEGDLTPWRDFVVEEEA